MSAIQFNNSLYGFPQPLSNQAYPPIVSLRTPTTTDFASLGTLWIYKTGNQAYVITSIVSNSATWLLLESSGGAGAFTTLTSTGNTALASGTGATFTAGNTTGAINIGSANTTATTTIGNNTSTSTLNLKSGSGGINLTGATVVTGTLSSTGATTLATTGASNSTLGNTTGTSSVGISVGSGGFTVTGVAGSVMTIGTGVTTGTINIGTAITTGAINIGTSSTTSDITIGNTGSTSVVNIDAGSGGVIVNSGLLVTGTIEGETLYVSADEGGVASTTALSNVTVPVAGGTGHFVTLAATGAGTTSSAGFIKMYVGTVAVYVPYWTQTT